MSAMPDSFLGASANDADAQETREWLDAMSAVIGTEGNDRAHFLLETLIAISGPRPIETVGNCQNSGISFGWG